MTKLVLMLIGITAAYIMIVVAPNYLEQKNYSKCAVDSITEQESANLSYAGNIRNDLAEIKLCYDNNGKAIFEDRSLFIPSFLQ